MYSTLKQPYSIRSVLVKVVAEKHRIKPLVLNKIIKCGIDGNIIAKHFLRLVSIFFVEIANCNDLGIVCKHAFIEI